METIHYLCQARQQIASEGVCQPVCIINIWNIKNISHDMNKMKVTKNYKVLSYMVKLILYESV